MIQISSEGKFEKLQKLLDIGKDVNSLLKKTRITAIANDGVKALAKATPKDSGTTASLWSYRVEESKGKTVIYWENGNVVDNVNIAIILQYGHATRTGGYVVGRDYINPALQPIFDKMSDELWGVVSK